jgi:hypothetical protein
MVPQTVCVIEINMLGKLQSELERRGGIFEIHTAKTLDRKFEIKIPRNETARPRSQFLHSCFDERFVYSLDRSPYFAVGK